jgi:hypothetical protein
MKALYSPILLLGATQVVLNAATILLPSTPVVATSSSSLSPTPNVALISINVSNAQVTVAGPTPVNPAFSATASGTSKIDLLSVGGFSLGGVTLSSTTRIDQSGIQFNTSTAITGSISSILSNAGAITNIVSAGVAPTWRSSINLTNAGIALAPDTKYSVDFDLSINSGLLSLSPALLNSFTATVSTGSGGTIPAQLFGITDLVSGSGKVSLEFKTGLVLDGPVLVNFGGQALLSANLLSGSGGLLGTGTKTVYSVKNISVNTVVPEPSGWMITVMLSGLALTSRNRKFL